MKIKLPGCAMSGKYRMVVSEDAEMTKIKHDTGEFSNLLTNSLMDRIGTFGSRGSSVATFNAVFGGVCVGAGRTPPQYTDTGLANQVAYTTRSMTVVRDVASYEAGYFELVVSFQFDLGEAAGNLSEIGISAGNMGPLCSRALILDEEGDPTTITVLAQDFLTCFYTLRINIPQVDHTYLIDVMYDEIPVETEVTIRPIAANNNSNSGGWGFATQLGGSNDEWRMIGRSNGDLSLPTSRYPGLAGKEMSLVPYVSGSYETWVRGTLGVGQWNGELNRMLTKCFMGAYQIKFDPPIQKNNTQEMEITVGYSWARA